MSSPKLERSSGIVLPDGTIAEALYNPATREAAFAVRLPDGSTEQVQTLKFGDRELVPNIDSMVANGSVLLPSQVGDFDSTEALAGEVGKFINTYVDMPDEWAIVVAYYVLFTWVYDAFTDLGYLRFFGDTATGKSRSLLTVGSLCYRPIFASGAVTPAPIFRAIEKHRGTLILDEADFRQSDARAEVVKILNVGYQSGFPVLRTEGENYEVRAYRVFCPKIIATRHRFEDDALETRCLTVAMGQTQRRDLPLSLPTSFPDEARLLRNKLVAFRLKTLPTLKPSPVYLTDGLEPRLAQILSPLMAIMSDHKPIVALARQLQDDVVTERADTLVAHVAAVLLNGYSGGQDPPSVSSVWDATSKMLINEGATQRELLEATPRKIGSIIRQLGLQTGRRTGGQRNYFVKRWRPDALAAMAVRFGLDTPRNRE